MRYGSICSGVEAASLAWRHLGWTPAFFAEVEPFPAAVLCHRLGATAPLRPLSPDSVSDEKERKQRLLWLNQLKELPSGGIVPNLGDFTLIKKGDYEGKIDLLVGGTPCQDLSIAGKRLGFEGSRSVLALDFVRLCFETGARWVCWENVPATLSSHDGRDFARFLSLLCGWEIPVPGDGWRKSGIVTGADGFFGVAWRVLDAQYTRVSQFPRAIPQRRKRLFLIGYLGSWKYPAQVLFEQEMCGGIAPPGRTKRQGAAAGTEGGFDSANSIRMRSGCPGGGKGPLIGDNLSHTLATGNDQTIVAFSVSPSVWTVDADRSNAMKSANPKSGFHEAEVAKTLDTTIPTPQKAQGGQMVLELPGTVFWNGDCVAGTLTCTSHNQLMPDLGRLQCVVEVPDFVECMDMRQIEVHSTGVVPTLIATDYKGGKAVFFTLPEKPPGYLCYENHAQDSRIRQVDVAQSITARMGTGGGNLPVVQVVTEKDVCPTLEANLFNKNTFQDCEKFIVENAGEYGSVIGFIRNEAGGAPQGFWDKVSPTFRAVLMPAVTWNECFHLSFCDANGRRKDRKNGGLYVTRAETSQTVTTKGPHTDTVIIALDGDKIAKAERRGGSGLGVSVDGVMYTQTVKDVHAVAYEEPVGIDQYNGSVTGNSAATLGINCGVSTGRNGVLERNLNLGVDLFNGRETGGVAATVSANSCATSTRNGPSVVECVPLDLRNATRSPEKHDAVNRQGVGVGADGDPMNTVTAACVHGVGWQATVRRLLPVECERLMGFPDNWTRIPWKGKSEEECPDAPRYKACGNSMCVNVMMWIGERIDRVEKLISSREGINIRNHHGGINE